MFNLLQAASDDQTALGACVLTLGIAALIVFISFHVGPTGQKLRALNRKQRNLRTMSDGSMAMEAAQERAA
jgi:hypothetical protein